MRVRLMPESVYSIVKRLIELRTTGTIQRQFNDSGPGSVLIADSDLTQAQRVADRLAGSVIGTIVGILPGAGGSIAGLGRPRPGARARRGGDRRHDRARRHRQNPRLHASGRHCRAARFPDPDPLVPSISFQGPF